MISYPVWLGPAYVEVRRRSWHATSRFVSILEETVYGDDVSFIFMVFHWPEPGCGDALARSMREMADLLAGTPGCIAVEPPYFNEDGGCLVGISKWESRQAFFASGIALRPADQIVEGETRPRERFLLEEAEI